jgi:hypothetical protein
VKLKPTKKNPSLYLWNLRLTLLPMSAGGNKKIWQDVVLFVQTQFFHTTCKHWAAQVEDTRDGENVHLQCHVNLKKKKRMSELLKILRMDSATANFNVEVCQDGKMSYFYCQKEDTRILGPWNDKLPFEPSVEWTFPEHLLDWQMDIDAKLRTCRSKGRNVFWVCDIDGDKGKIFFYFSKLFKVNVFSCFVRQNNVCRKTGS